MPFKPITEGKDKGKYMTPSGHVMSKAQVLAYYAAKNAKGQVREKNKK